MLMAGVAALLGAAGARGGENAKLLVCHIPPDDPASFHTITVSEKALTAHLGHGDLLGRCNQYCDSLCDDGNPCTIDACDEETGACVADHAAVDCEDGDPCTVNSCEPSTGCLSAPVSCDDSDVCTVDVCSAGVCLHGSVDCGPGQLCDPTTGCFDPCAGVVCEPVDQCHASGSCAFPGECLAGPPLINGSACDDGNPSTEYDQCFDGICSGSESTCTADDQCEAGKVCELRFGCNQPMVCVPGCHDDADCAAGQACTHPACLTCPCPGTCSPAP